MYSISTEWLLSSENSLDNRWGGVEGFYEIFEAGEGGGKKNLNLLRGRIRS